MKDYKKIAEDWLKENPENLEQFESIDTWIKRFAQYLTEQEGEEKHKRYNCSGTNRCPDCQEVCEHIFDIPPGKTEFEPCIKCDYEPKQQEGECCETFGVSWDIDKKNNWCVLLYRDIGGVRHIIKELNKDCYESGKYEVPCHKGEDKIELKTWYNFGSGCRYCGEPNAARRTASGEWKQWELHRDDCKRPKPKIMPHQNKLTN